MTGTKAQFLEDWAVETGHDFLRFDYSGHGASSGRFEDGAISDWIRDAAEVIRAKTRGPQVLVGSSMGGWIALALAARGLVDVAGLVGIAAAPDFTEDSMWADMTPDQRNQLMAEGQIAVPTEYDDQPYIITRRLIEDGRDCLVLRAPLPLPFPVRLLHGTADVDVAQSVPLRLLDHAQGDDIALTLVKGADHRFSEPDNLAMIGASVAEVIARTQ